MSYINPDGQKIHRFLETRPKTELKKMLNHAEKLYERSVMPEDVKYWYLRIVLLKDHIKDKLEEEK